MGIDIIYKNFQKKYKDLIKYKNSNFFVISSITVKFERWSLMKELIIRIDMLSISNKIKIYIK